MEVLQVLKRFNPELVQSHKFLALHNTATPVAVSVATVLLNLGLSITLTRVFGWGIEGLALSLATSTTVEMLLMWTLLGRKLPGWGLNANGMFPSIAKSALAAATMGLALALIMPALQSLLPNWQTNKLSAATLALAGIITGSLIYLATARALRSAEVTEALGLLARRLRK